MHKSANPLADAYGDFTIASRLSFREGRALQSQPAPGLSLTAMLERAAKEHARHGVAQLLADGSILRLTYAQLLGDAHRILGGLRRKGVLPGHRVLLQLESGQDYFPSFWACLLGGFVPVPATLPPNYAIPHAALTKLQNAWGLLEHPYILTSHDRVEGLGEFGRRQHLDAWRALDLAELRTQGEAHGASYAAQPNEIAVLLLTSGSTGLPKAVSLTHANLVSHAIGNASLNQLTSEDPSFNWMPLDHVGALVMFHLRDVFLGSEQIHAAPDVILQNPANWLAWMDRYKIVSTWAPNFAFALINDLAETFAGEKWDLSRLRLIINGGEAVVARTGRRFLSLMEKFRLPPTALHPAWGMSETSSGTLYSSSFQVGTTSDSDVFVSVGVPMPGISVRVVDDQGVVVAEGVTGNLEVSGAVVTAGYERNPKANSDAFTRDGWFKTGDLSFMRDGEVTIAGREKDVIIINGVNFHGHEIEGVIDQLEGVEVSFTAACAVRTPGNDTDELAVFYCPREGAPENLAREIKARIVKEIGANIDHLVALTKDRIPKTSIGKIQRSALKSQFEKGEFASLLRANQLPRWFFRREWRAAPAEAGFEENHTWVIFMDHAGLGERLIRLLAAGEHRAITVGAGSAFEIKNDSSLLMNMSVPADYDTLVQHLDSVAKGGCTFVHLGSFGLDPSAGRTAPLGAGTAHSLLYFAGAFTRRHEGSSSARLLVVSSRAQSVSPNDKIDPAHGPMLGLLKTFPHELPALDSAHVDLPPETNDRNAAILIQEAKVKSLQGEVAFRDGLRYVSGLEQIPQSVPQNDADSLKVGGSFILTGGLGGIGRELAEMLLTRLQGRVIITGRDKRDSFSPEKRDAMAKLEKLGTIVYETVDVTDLESMRAVLSRAESRFGNPPDCILHLAGTYHESLLADEKVEGLDRAIRAKAEGARVLGLLVQQHPQTRLVLFSSLLGYFGGFMTGAYGAANRFLESFTLEQRQFGRARTHCLLWSSWSDLGMSKGLRDNVALRAKGFQEMSPAQAWDSLCVALGSTQPVVLIGLDSSNQNVAKELSESATGKPGTTAAREFVEARDDIEKKLVGIWKSLLKAPVIGIHESFFDLGGRSLLAAKLFAQIHREFGRSLPLSTLFTFSTVAQLAEVIRGSPLSPAGNSGQQPSPAVPPTAENPPCTILQLQPKGKRPPFFCIPGAGSDATVFQDLARALGNDQPLYGLQARGLDATVVTGEYPSVEEVARDFIAAIRDVRPSGPYIIGGHCFGCLIAWEVARQLQAAEIEVEEVVLIDPIVSNVFSDDIVGRDRFRYHAGKFLRMSITRKAGYFVDKIRNFGRTLVVRRRISHSYQQARWMHEKYKLNGYQGRVTIVLADDSYLTFVKGGDPRRFYESIAVQPVAYLTASGDHHSIIHEPAVSDLARKLIERWDNPNLIAGSQSALVRSP